MRNWFLVTTALLEKLLLPRRLRGRRRPGGLRPEGGSPLLLPGAAAPGGDLQTEKHGEQDTRRGPTLIRDGRRGRSTGKQQEVASEMPSPSFTSFACSSTARLVVLFISPKEEKENHIFTENTAMMQLGNRQSSRRAAF